MSREPTRDPDQAAERLLDLVRTLVRETHPNGGGAPAVTLDSRLDRDLGLDSLGRTELCARAARAFGVVLPDEALLSETPGALLAALGAAPRPEFRPRTPRERGIEAASGVPAEARTLVEVLQWHVAEHPDRVHIRLYGETGDEALPLTYAELLRGAERMAAGLAGVGVTANDRVALMLPTGRDYFHSFFGILLAGGVPVPIYPPARPAQLADHLRRHGRILENAGVAVLVTVPEAIGVARLLKGRVGALRHIETAASLSAAAGRITAASRRGDDLAFLQYTSGSTGDPKGVSLSHAHLLANIRAMGEAAGVSSSDLFVSWLPLYHDMGLIGAWLGSLYFAMPLVVMSPLRFLARPAEWLWAIHRHGATLSAAPNFAYELCVGRIDAAEIEGLDLSSWRRAFNGAEPVSPDTLRRFAERFGPYGLNPQALAPVYGLAEAAVGLAFPPPGRGPRVERIRRDLFRRSGRAEPSDADQDSLQMVACGRPLPGYRVQVVDDAGRPLPERREGRLEFQGPSATSGYFGNPQATRRLFRDGWLDTGDRAYLADGEIFVTGRVKELIIRGGRNLFPYELELAVGAIPGIRRGCVAVFAAADGAGGTERLVVAAETREQRAPFLEALRRAIRERSLEVLDMPPDDILLLPPRTIPKTSSGKLRRAELRTRFEQGTLGRRGGRLWMPLLAWAWGGGPKRLAGAVAETAFAGWAWAAAALVVPFGWLGIVTLPRPAWRWTLGRVGLWLLRRLTGVRLRVDGLEHLPPPGSPCVVVANHSSYLDGPVLTAALTRDAVFVAKREFTLGPLTRIPLERLGCLFVDRFDTRRGAEGKQALVERLTEGACVAVFPEGTFRRTPGLLPFRAGAFAAAAEAGAPVIPVTILGTRRILPADTSFPRRGAIRVFIDPPIFPQGADWTAAMQLRDAARTRVRERCGEPDLGGGFDG